MVVSLGVPLKYKVIVGLNVRGVTNCDYRKTLNNKQKKKGASVSDLDDTRIKDLKLPAFRHTKSV